MKIFRFSFYILNIGVILVFAIGCDKKDVKAVSNNNKINIDKNKEEFTPVFKKEDIPKSVYEKMLGKSIPNKDLVDISQLSYLTITYYGFDDKPHIGEMIVNKSVDNEVLDIFKELFEKKYPIEKMRLIDEYNADDNLAMKDNNTSAFNYRVIEGSNVLSNHAKGLAIDINTLINPMVKNGQVSPKEGEKYIDRTINAKGMIKKGDACYEAFIKRGWTWGGDWNTLKDYQHFEK